MGTDERSITVRWTSTEARGRRTLRVVVSHDDLGREVDDEASRAPTPRGFRPGSVAALERARRLCWPRVAQSVVRRATASVLADARAVLGMSGPWSVSAHEPHEDGIQWDVSFPVLETAAGGSSVTVGASEPDSWASQCVRCGLAFVASGPDAVAARRDPGAARCGRCT